MISCFFPLGFVLTDALAGCRLWMVILISGAISSLVGLSQLYFKLGLFEFDDIFNNILGAAQSSSLVIELHLCDSEWFNWTYSTFAIPDRWRDLSAVLLLPL